MKNRRISGFTLFEVVIALMIFSLLVVAVYFSVDASIKAAATLSERQMETRTEDSFERFLREGFLNLPGEAGFELVSKDRGQLGRSIELIIRNASGCFGSGTIGVPGSGVVLATVPDGKGSSRFSLMRFPDRLTDPEVTKAIDTGEWVPVLPGITSLRWRFWQDDRRAFLETWGKNSGRPDAVELTYTVGNNEPITSFFRLPKVGGAAARQQ
jgi:prepilin-type N-terminal cleavage/methylation domain-containing protein